MVFWRDKITKDKKNICEDHLILNLQTDTTYIVVAFSKIH